MRIGLNLMTFDEKTVRFSVNENNVTGQDLLDLMDFSSVSKGRFLKIPKTKTDPLQTINVDTNNLGLSLNALGFQDDADYTFVALEAN